MSGRTRKIVLIVCGAAVLIGLPVLWRWTPLSEWASIGNAVDLFSRVRSSDFVALWVVAFYVVGALLFLPINLLIFVTALLFENAHAYLFVILGVVSSTTTGYAAGRLGGARLIEKIGSGRLNRVAEQLGDADFMDVFLFRLIPVTPFSTINVICGALEMPWLRFYGATFASVAPGATLIVLFERSLMAFGRNMTWQTGIALTAALAALVGGGFWLKRWAARRRHGR